MRHTNQLYRGIPTLMLTKRLPLVKVGKRPLGHKLVRGPSH